MQTPVPPQLLHSTVPPPSPPPFQRCTLVMEFHRLPVVAIMSAALPEARVRVKTSCEPMESSQVSTTLVGDTKVALLHTLSTELGCAAASAVPGSSATALLLPLVGAAAPPMRTSTREPLREEGYIVTAKSWPPYSTAWYTRGTALKEWSSKPLPRTPCGAYSTPPSPATQYALPSCVATDRGAAPTAQLSSAVDVSTAPLAATRATTRGQPAVASVEPTAQPRQPSTTKRPSVERDRCPT